MSDLQAEWDRNTKGLNPSMKVIAVIVIVIVIWLIVS